MIDFRLDSFWESVHPRLKNGHLYSGYGDVIRFGIRNGHNDLRYKYRLSDWFINIANNVDVKIEYEDGLNTEKEIGEWVTHQDSMLTSPDISDEHILNMTKKWAYHMLRHGSGSVMNGYRFGSNHLVGKPDTENMLSLLYDTYNSIRNDNYPEFFKYQNLCRGLWMLTTAGYTSDVIEIVEFFKKELLTDGSKLLKLYDGDSGGNRSIDNRWRVVMSMSWPLAQCYKHIGDFESAKKVYRDITTYNVYGKLLWYTSTNRVLEAGIELYKLEPTEENKQWCYDTYYQISNLNLQNNQEALDERLMVSYMFYEEVIGKELK